MMPSSIYSMILTFSILSFLVDMEPTFEKASEPPFCEGRGGRCDRCVDSLSASEIAA